MYRIIKVLRWQVGPTPWVHAHTRRHVYTSTEPSTFKFASALSTHKSLYVAVQDCIKQVRQQSPDTKDWTFCQLLITPSYYSCGIDFTPKYVKHLLEDEGCSPGVLIGGVVRGVFGAGTFAADEPPSPPSVSLIAAHMPGVQAYPFHAEQPSLPPLPDAAWPQLAVGCSAGHQRAAVVLSVPRFVEVEAFIKRLYNAVPALQVVGGVTEPSAWGEGDVPHGALFLGTKTLGSGVVGVILDGPFQMEAILTPGCKPFGRVSEVTAAEGNELVALDHTPAALVVRDIAGDLEKFDDVERLAVGVDEGGTGEFVARSLHLAKGLRVAVAVREVQTGTRVQLQLRDSAHAEQQLQLKAQDLKQKAALSGDWAGGLLYSCVTVPHNELDPLQEALPGLQVGGGKMQGEFGRQAPVGNPRLQSFSSSLALFRPPPGPAAAPPPPVDE